MPDTAPEHADRAAGSFDAFYPWAFDQVYRSLVLTLGDAQLAADATQEALTRAYARWDDVAGYVNPAGWVYRVALNWARSTFRRRARERLFSRLPAVAAPPPPPSADPAVTAALAQLPLSLRAVVVLRLYLDWPVDRVAAALSALGMLTPVEFEARQQPTTAA